MVIRSMNTFAQSTVVVKIPASTANLGPGFDAIGMALSLYEWIEVSIVDQTEVRLYGDGMEGIPTDESNLVYKIVQYVFEQAGYNEQPVKISMLSDIPLTRGLGSSASAIVGALVAANTLIGDHFTKEELFKMATEMEGHPDNVGAALFGGIVISSWDGQQAPYVKLTPPEALTTSVAIPHFELSTEKARHALPEMYSKNDTVFNLGRSALLVAALAEGKLELLQLALQDKVHQPYRAALVPGLAHILQHAHEKSSLGAALSGAGPTVICFVDKYKHTESELHAFLAETFAQEQIETTIMTLQPDLLGTQIIYTATKYDATFDFIALIEGAHN